MMEKIKNKIFPCAEKMKAAMEENSQATQRLIKACSPNTFPALREGQIVNPR